MKEKVDQPDHYTTGQIECIDYLKDNMTPEGFKGYLEGCAKKYLHRFKYKSNPLVDLSKAMWYTDRLISELESEQVPPLVLSSETPGTLTYHTDGSTQMQGD